MHAYTSNIVTVKKKRWGHYIAPTYILNVCKVEVIKKFLEEVFLVKTSDSESDTMKIVKRKQQVFPHRGYHSSKRIQMLYLLKRYQ